MESVFENGSLITAPGTVSINGYTSYPSAFMVINADGIFSKHYYAGTQRIVSRLGDTDASIFDIGNNKSKTNNAPILDFQKLQQAQKQSLNQISEQLKSGEVQFKPYQASPLKETLLAYDVMDEDTLTAQKTTVANPIYFYHPDHLGTSTALTDVTGEPYQFFLNLPFGETMAEQLGNQYYNSPYKFNGKELDEETSLYYYGARYYDPKVSNWLSVDPLANKYPSVSPYVYCLDNPINAVDPDGKDVIFVNGFSYHDMNNKVRGGSVDLWRKNKYWNINNPGFTDRVGKYFNDKNHHFLSASQMKGSKAINRQREGYNTALEMVNSGEIIISANNPITVVMHSQGNAYGAGYMQGILDAGKAAGIDVKVNGVMLSTHQPNDINTKNIADKSIQYTYDNDNSGIVAPMGKVPGVTDANPSNKNYGKGGLDAHSATIDKNEAFDAIKKVDSEKKIYIRKGE